MSELVPKPPDATRLPDEIVPIETGQWYWIKVTDRKKTEERLCCVMHVGTNFAKLTEAASEHGGSYRVHFADFLKECRRELDPEAVIRSRTEHYQTVVREKLNQIKEVTARLGVADHRKIEQRVEESSRALSTLSGTNNVDKYKKDLIKAHTKTLPKLFKEVEEANKQMTCWMEAQALPAQGMVNGLKNVIGEIEGRIFNVSLYAGLTEEITQLTDGEPAELTEKLRLLQRLHFMDEEALIGYQHGGMEFHDIEQFDHWVTRPENANRIFGYPRCMVAFRVRRKEKYRDPEAFGGGFGAALVIAQLKELDESTFLYIKNGQRFYRMNCDLDFDTKVFPSKTELNLNEPMMIGTFAGDIQDDLLITKREYAVLVEKEKERKAKCKEWLKANPDVPWIERPSWVDDHGPFYRLENYEPFDKSSVHFDDMVETITNRVKYYNRIALIIQGLYDRSDVLHPHPPYQLWKPDGFETAVELIYDGSNVLEYGDAPDIKRYVAECNAKLQKGSITIGQYNFWGHHENEKAEARSYRNRDMSYRPYGNPGPGSLAEVAEWNPKTRMATFRWQREFQGWWRSNYYGPKKRGDLVPASIAVPADKLFNVSGYVAGDYKKFFADPRTREHYLSWAPLLLTAEEFVAGNLDAKGALKKKNKMPKLKPVEKRKKK